MDTEETKMEEVVLTKMVAKTKHSFYRLYVNNFNVYYKHDT